MNEKLNRGLVSLALSILMLIIGSMTQRVFPVETQYVGYLFLFGASLFLADAAVTMTRMSSGEAAAADELRDRAAAPWQVAFGLAFVLTLFASARTGNSFVTVTAMLLAVTAAVVYLVRRRFLGNLRDVFRLTADPAAQLHKAYVARDHASIAAMLEERIDLEKDPGRRNALLLMLGAVHVVRGSYDDAVRAFERLDRRVRTEKATDGLWLDTGFVADLNLASAYIAKADFDSAESCLSRIDGDRLPSEFRLAWHMNRSSLLVGKGEHGAAIRFLESIELEKLEPASQMPFLRDLAEALAASGSDPERAMRVAEKCLAIDEGPQALNVMGFVLLSLRKFEAARERFEAALARNPDGQTNLRVFAETHYYLGLSLKGLGKLDDAGAEFRRAAAVHGGGRFAAAAAREGFA